jgi:6-phosphogluconate dehydrogenase
MQIGFALSAAVNSRFYSRAQGDHGARVLAALRNQFGGHAVKKSGS